MSVMDNGRSFKRTAAFMELSAAYQKIKGIHMRALFEAEPDRFNQYAVQWDEILFDPSKNIMDAEVFNGFARMGEEMQLHAWFQKMLSGEKINVTEDRPVLHTALRNFSGEQVFASGTDVMPGIRKVREQMKHFSDAVISGSRKGFSGKQFTDVVNIGIGGSDLGPNMVCEALAYYRHPHLKVHFVSNVDAAHILETIRDLNPETTLFLIASKTFTTQETMENAHTARQWVIGHYGDAAAVAGHFVALSTAEQEVRKFGINTADMFAFWDWVGGRYSLWSAIGLSICLAVGYANFESLLKGAEAADRLTSSQPFNKNIPMQMAMLGLWYNEWFNRHTYAVIPYVQYLHRFPAYLQQADMESNGKSVHRDGTPVQHATGPVIWGEPGTNGQHAFFQLMHQGTEVIPADFIATVHPVEHAGAHHKILLSNCLAQTEALMRGKTTDEVEAELSARGMDTTQISQHKPFRTFAGNRPSNTLMLDKLTPYNLGMLIAIYEHKIFFQGILWNIFSFDQWGVELGKKLAAAILPELDASTPITTHDPGTNGLINYIRSKTTQ